MNLEGNLCRLRALEPADAEAMYAWENDTAVWPVSGTLAPFSREAVGRFIAEQRFDLYAARQLRLVIETLGGACAGALDLFEVDPHDLRAGVGILVAPPYRRRGVAADALAVAEGYARRTLGLHQLWCTVGADNAASLALFRRAGYVECGRRREWLRTPDGWRDEVMMQRML